MRPIVERGQVVDVAHARGGGRVAGVLAGLAHHRDARHHAERGERAQAAVAVGRGELTGLQDPVVVVGGTEQPGRPADLAGLEAELVVADDGGVVAEGIAGDLEQADAGPWRALAAALAGMEVEALAAGGGEVAGMIVGVGSARIPGEPGERREQGAELGRVVRCPSGAAAASLQVGGAFGREPGRSLRHRPG